MVVFSRDFNWDVPTNDFSGNTNSSIFFQKKSLRLLFRELLGFGVVIGMISIVKAPHILIGLFQFLLGVGLYLGIGINRIRMKAGGLNAKIIPIQCR
ncbi:MAG: hypothetical protein ACFFC6_04010 [Promethearchaeota archaeon]